MEKQINILRPQLVACAADKHLHWDLRGIDSLDSAGAALLWQVWGKRRMENLSLRPEHDALFARLDAVPGVAPARGPIELTAPLIATGKSALAFIDYLHAIVLLFGQVVLDVGYLLLHASRAPWREISANIYRVGAQALPITALVGFLVGVVIGYLSAQQLQIFGAGVYIINILGIGIIREL